MIARLAIPLLVVFVTSVFAEDTRVDRPVAAMDQRGQEVASAEPFDIGGGWSTCPAGFFITYAGSCIPWHDPREGPIVEYGCELRNKANGDVVQSCPATKRIWVGNVGLPGAPVTSLVAPAVIFGPVIGIAVVAPHVGRR